MKTISKGVIMLAIIAVTFFAPYSLQSISTQVNTAYQGIDKINSIVESNNIILDNTNIDITTTKAEMIDIPVSHYIEREYGTGEFIKYSSAIISVEDGKKEYASKYKIIIPGYTYYNAQPDKEIVISSNRLTDLKFDLYYRKIS